MASGRGSELARDLSGTDSRACAYGATDTPQGRQFGVAIRQACLSSAAAKSNQLIYPLIPPQTVHFRPS
ncbi:hypothetical protein PSYAC_26911 [Pseudomonas syringae pv. actinidiae str. M302091]|nr:hypothetical protein PSYAC_26911 [Pseudomonas syringae pv. actinidiae str. M302091]